MELEQYGNLKKWVLENTHKGGDMAVRVRKVSPGWWDSLKEGAEMSVEKDMEGVQTSRLGRVKSPKSGAGSQEQTGWGSWAVESVTLIQKYTICNNANVSILWARSSACPNQHRSSEFTEATVIYSSWGCGPISWTEQMLCIFASHCPFPAAQSSYEDFTSLFVVYWQGLVWAVTWRGSHKLRSFGS